MIVPNVSVSRNHLPMADSSAPFLPVQLGLKPKMDWQSRDVGTTLKVNV